MTDKLITDEQMDARLRAAGLAFRDGEPASPDAYPQVSTGAGDEPIELGTVTAGGVRSRRPVALILSAVAVAAALVLGVLIAVHGTGGDNGSPAAGQPPNSQLVGKTWTLFELETIVGDGPGAGASGKGASGRIALSFDSAGAISLSFLRGSARGTVEIDPHVLRIGDLVDGPLAAGPGPAADEIDYNQDLIFVRKVLAGTVTWSISRGQLVIVNDHQRLIFNGPGTAARLKTDPDAAGLYANNWSVNGVQYNGAVSGGSETADGSTITFSAGRYVLSQPCGQTSGAAVLDGQHVVLSDPAITTRDCPTDGTDNPHIDTVVRSVLRGSVAWSVNGGVLTLTRGDTSLTFIVK